MKKTQFESYTTCQDKEYFEREYIFKPKEKIDFVYCFLMTIARKESQEENKCFDFVLQSSNKVSANTLTEFNSNNHIKYIARYTWNNFMIDY